MPTMRDLQIGTTGLRGLEFDAGEGAPVLFWVHGGPGANCRSFARVVETLPPFSDVATSWFMYDQRGCGASHATGAVRHEHNIEDLIASIRFAMARYGDRLVGIIGHSYGGWLLSDAVRALKGESLPVCIMVAIDMDRFQTRHRNLMIELVEAKIKSPGHYREFFASLPEVSTSDSWRIKDRLRAYPYARDVRRHFYWANLDAMDWFETLRRDVAMPDRDEVFVSVRDSMYLCDPQPIDPKILPPLSFRIIGTQDFLMHGGVVQEDGFTIYLQRSGHYPHIEQPHEFMRIIRERLNI